MKRTIKRLGKLQPFGKFRVLLTCGHVVMHDQGVDARGGIRHDARDGHTCWICAARKPQ